MYMHVVVYGTDGLLLYCLIASIGGYNALILYYSVSRSKVFAYGIPLGAICLNT